MRLRTVALALLALVGVLDVWTTQAGIDAGAVELNPVGYYIVAAGVPAMLAAKAAVWAAIAAVGRWSRRGQLFVLTATMTMWALAAASNVDVLLSR